MAGKPRLHNKTVSKRKKGERKAPLPGHTTLAIRKAVLLWLSRTSKSCQRTPCFQGRTDETQSTPSKNRKSNLIPTIQVFKDGPGDPEDHHLIRALSSGGVNPIIYIYHSGLVGHLQSECHKGSLASWRQNPGIEQVLQDLSH